MALKSEQVSRLARVFGDRLVTAKHEMIIHSQDVGSLPKQVGWLIQSSSTMGGMYIGLFDDHKHCVLLVHWGDAWVGSTK